MSLLEHDDAHPEIEDILGPVRDQYVIAFITALRDCEALGDEVVVETVRKDPNGAIRRYGMLSLPIRDDGTCDAGSDLLNVPPQKPVYQESHLLTFGKTLTCEIRPFVWNDVWICTQPPCPSALLMRLRLWYLDWFQSRVVDSSEDLSGALHRFDGPHEQEDGHWFHADLGTAPVDAILSLLELLAAGQVRICTIGYRPDFA